VVHLNQFAFGALPFLAPRLVVGHSCVCSWWRAVLGVPAPGDWDRYRAMAAAGLDAAELVAAPTAAMLAALHAEHGFRAPGVVLPNGRDARAFAPGRKEPFVFGAGRLWDAAKNLAALEAVAPSLPWPVRVAGPLEHPDGGRRGASGVVLLGVLDSPSLAAEMARAAVFALPARYEPFGLAALEAALSGCALVLGDIPSLRELWSDAALFVEPDDTVALRAALLELAGDERRRAVLAEAARTRALAYSTERMTDAYLAAYRGLRRRPTAAQPATPQGAHVPEAACAS
jgi:glycosyltransferase involved in cell wall biosynthesis